MIISLHFRCYFVHTSVVDERNDVVRRSGFLSHAVDDIGGGAVGVAKGEGVPFGGDTRVDGELIAVLAETQDILDASLICPGGGAGVPCPSAASRMLRIAVDVGSHTEWFNLVFQHICEGLSTVDGVNDRIEIVSEVVATLLELSHNIPHSAMCVLTAILADTHGVVHDIAR